MSALLDLERPALTTSPNVMRRVIVGRAVLALAWAGAVLLAVGDRVPSTASGVPTAAALLLASYPVIDVAASLIGARFADARLLRINAAISGLAALTIAIAAFGSDAGATLAAFGAWAVVSGGLQLATALRRRRLGGGQLPMAISGGVSALAGLSFVAASRGDEARLATLAGYMTAGAVLFLLAARRSTGAATGVTASDAPT